jgi:hypothetical protein
MYATIIHGKYLFAQGKMNIGEYLLRQSQGKYSPIFTELEEINYLV